MNAAAEYGLQVYVQPWTAKKGVGYALLANYNKPQTVTVMVSHGKLRRLDAAALPQHYAFQASNQPTSVHWLIYFHQCSPVFSVIFNSVLICNLVYSL